MKLNRSCFHVSISSEDQKKGFTENLKSFCPQNQVKTEKKKVFTENLRVFFPKTNEDQKKSKINQRSDADHSQIIERMQMQTIGKLFGGDAVKLLGGIYPPIPRVSAPLINYQDVKMWNAIPVT